MSNGDLVLYGGFPLDGVNLVCDRQWSNAIGLPVANESHTLRIHVLETGEHGEWMLWCVCVHAHVCVCVCVCARACVCVCTHRSNISAPRGFSLWKSPTLRDATQPDKLLQQYLPPATRVLFIFG